MPSLINLLPLKFRPGFVQNLTDYSNAGGWFSGNWVRFRDGLPEKMGGWVKQISTTFNGVCRAMFSWATLGGTEYVSLGTNTKFYVCPSGTSYVDVTPIRDAPTLGADPFASTNTSTTVRVTDVAHGATNGSYVTFSGATGFAGIPAGDLNTEFAITYDDADHYFITVATAATSTTTGGGAAVVASYQINIGYATTFIAFGWGTGAWGRGTWGSAAGSVTVDLRLWSQDTFGEDLFTCIRNGGLYLWDATAPTTRMVALDDLPGQTDAPTVATCVLVSAEERHAIAFGSNPIGSATQDPLFIRWSDSEDILNWTPAITNSAGGDRLSVGTEILRALHSRREMVVFTDTAVYAMQWTGPPYTFSLTLVGTNNSTIAPNAAIATNDFVVWMGRNQFFIYDGRIAPIECPVSDYIFTRLNTLQIDKIYAFINTDFNEVGWLYPSTDGNECDSYVIFNYKEKAWYFGDIDRTAWLDRGPSALPLATSSDSYLYDQEFGFDDGSTNPPTPIEAYIESSPIEIGADGQGGHYMFLTRLIPDVTFRNSSAPAPAVDMTLSMRNYPGTAVAQTQTGSIVRSVTLPIQQFTPQAFVRLRGRSVVFKCSSNAVGVTWRLGVPRIDYRLDGRR